MPESFNTVFMKNEIILIQYFQLDALPMLRDGGEAIQPHEGQAEPLDFQHSRKLVRLVISDAADLRTVYQEVFNRPLSG